MGQLIYLPAVKTERARKLRNAQTRKHLVDTYGEVVQKLTAFQTRDKHPSQVYKALDRVNEIIDAIAEAKK